MTDPSTSGNRWEPDAPSPTTAPPTTPAPPTQPGAATAVQDPPAAGTWAPPPVPQRHGLKDRWRTAPRGARLGAAGAVAFLLLLGVGLGGFALGRGTAPEGDGQPGVGDGRLGDRDGDGDLGRGPGGPRGLPGQGTAPDGTDLGDDGTGTGTLSWYVVPNPTGTGTSAA